MGGDWCIPELSFLGSFDSPPLNLGSKYERPFLLTIAHQSYEGHEWWWWWYYDLAVNCHVPSGHRRHWILAAEGYQILS